MLYKLMEELEALIEKWENAPYTGDLTKAAKAVCAKELRAVIGEEMISAERVWRQDRSSNDAPIPEGYYDEELPF